VSRPSPRAAIFDCDGLLVDSADCWGTAFREAAGSPLSGIEPETLNGVSVETGAARLGAQLGRHVSPSRLRRSLEEAVVTEAVEPMPGAMTLLRGLSGRLPLAVASNGPASVVDAMLERVGMRHTFVEVVCAEQVAAPKPDPAVYLEACGRLGVPPEKSVGFEDSRLGAAAARAAGLFVVAIVPPGEEIDADLVAPRLDDPAVLELAGVQRKRDAG
jgi:HAD superfamily hydrolase (TIGR01509 family)